MIKYDAKRPPYFILYYFLLMLKAKFLSSLIACFLLQAVIFCTFGHAKFFNTHKYIHMHAYLHTHSHTDTHKFQLVIKLCIVFNNFCHPENSNHFEVNKEFAFKTKSLVLAKFHCNALAKRKII